MSCENISESLLHTRARARLRSCAACTRHLSKYVLDTHWRGLLSAGHAHTQPTYVIAVGVLMLAWKSGSLTTALELVLRIAQQLPRQHATALLTGLSRLAPVAAIPHRRRRPQATVQRATARWPIQVRVSRAAWRSIAAWQQHCSIVGSVD